MILGVGLDLARRPRFQEAWERWGQRFLDRCYTPAEQTAIQAKNPPWDRMAMYFAAKEALSKACGVGLKGLGSRGFRLVEIEVTHDLRGKPHLTLHGQAREWAEQMGVKSSHLSLTDDGEYAAAVVVVEG